MAKKKKRKDKLHTRKVNHEQHHQAIHEYIMKELEGEGMSERHLIPVSQPWHVEHPWCFCRPKREDWIPTTNMTTWFHPALVH